MTTLDSSRSDFHLLEAEWQRQRKAMMEEKPSSLKLYSAIYIRGSQAVVATCWEEAQKEMEGQCGKRPGRRK